MKYYAEEIQKFERQLHFPVSNFSDILKENDSNSAEQKQESGVANYEP